MRRGRLIAPGSIHEVVASDQRDAAAIQGLTGRFDLIEEYCRQDVVVLRDLYLFGRREGHVVVPDKEDRLVRVPVDWV